MHPLFCGLVSGGSWGLMYVQGHLRLLTQQDITFQQEGLPRQILCFSSKVATMCLFL